MATGDQSDVYTRLVGVIPRWFGDFTQAPIVSALLQGFAEAGAFVYSLISYAKLQLRIKTATDGWLDMIASDFFGTSFWRKAGQSDASFRAAIIANILRERGTRNAIIKVCTDLTGRAPVLVEFNRPTDTGSYSGPYFGYGAAGAYGTLNPMPLQAMVTAYRPTPGSGFTASDADIFAAVDSVRPVTTTLWTSIGN